MQTIGLFGAARCTLDVFTWLATGAMDSRAYGTYQGFFTSTWNDTEDTTIDVRCAQFKRQQAQFCASQAGVALEGMVSKNYDLSCLSSSTCITYHRKYPFPVALVDVVDMRSACKQVTLGLVQSFISLLAPVPLPKDISTELDSLERAAKGGQPAGGAARRVMARLLSNVAPADLDASLAENGTATNLKFGVPLVAPKAAVLLQALQAYRGTAAVQKHWSGIVFAQQRMAVMGLAALLQTAQCCSSWMRVSPFMAQGPAVGGMAFMPTDQTDILRRFKSGDLNLLVSTSVAEEGIDVKGCQLVVRFDLATNAQAFQQSRGRARMAGSHLLALMEEGNLQQEQTVSCMNAYNVHVRQAAVANAELVGLEDDENVASESSSDVELSGGLGPDAPYMVPSTGAVVSLHNALNLLGNYVAKLPGDEFMLLRPAYRLEYLHDGTIRAVVRLPGSSAVSHAVGTPSPSKRRAKASAALAACRMLHQAEALDDRLLPALLLGPEDEENDLESVPGVEKISSVDIQSELPKALATPLVAASPSQTFEVACYTLASTATGANSVLGLVLPAGALEAVDWGSGAEDALGGLAPAGTIALSPEEFHLLLECSTILRQHAGSWCVREPFKESAATYALAVMTHAGVGASNGAAAPLDWDAMRQIVELHAASVAGVTVLDMMRSAEGGQQAQQRLLEDKLLMTPYNKMLYVCKGEASGMLLSSPFPQDKYAVQAPSTFAEYYAKRWGKSDLDEGQPLLTAARVNLSGLKHFGPAGAAVADESPAFLVPQLCTVHYIPATLWPALNAAPRQMWSVEGGLVARSLLNNLVASGLPADGMPPLATVRLALTATSAMDTAGDYEILESLGDSFLKYATTAQLYLQYPGYHEGQLTTAKDRMVSNSKLIRVALELGLERCIRVKAFTDDGSNGNGKALQRVS